MSTKVGKKKLPTLGYYSSKPGHKNRALWTPSSSTAIGDPFTKYQKPPSRTRSRQFQVSVTVEIIVVWLQNLQSVFAISLRLFEMCLSGLACNAQHWNATQRNDNEGNWRALLNYILNDYVRRLANVRKTILANFSAWISCHQKSIDLTHTTKKVRTCHNYKIIWCL